MPTPHLIAMLRSVKPAEAARLLQSVTVDRMAVIVTELPPADLIRIILGAPADRAGKLLLGLPAEVRVTLLQQLTIGQFADLLPRLDPAITRELLRELAPRAVAEIVSSLPDAVQSRLRELLTPDQPVEFASALYQRDAANLMVRTASAVSWLDQWTGDLLAEVLGKSIQVAVRYRLDPLTDLDVDQSARRGRWQSIAGMLLLTNVAAAASAAGHAQALSRSGRPFEVQRWIDDRDSGMVKRALIRLTG
ncbi:magnesium transporter MgtE N-terminal domain-containing protein [Rhizomonospora bruguierae]|uniref:magnesium transporter MgtE N-terminal domain-containing protein n=1 Tax=Rhizomonospora bruguierae TaxID=1581705 RepID=UPI0024BDB377|nr:hypothetical protein [Micromonospora sp. NBRC 107566]